MNSKTTSLLTGASLGIGLMYLLDPTHGQRRRARMRDQVTHLLRKTGDGLDATARDFSNRMTGAAAELQRWFDDSEPEERVLLERVRSAIGRAVAHPHAIRVSVRDGSVRLDGPVLSGEVEPLLAAVSAVPGVAGVDNQLVEHERPGAVPALQGGTSRPRRLPGWLDAKWSPTTRMVASVTGGALTAYGISRRSVTGTGAAVVGIGLVTRSVTNLETSRLVGIGAGRRAVDIHKTLDINAPISHVFDFWNNYQDFPRFTRNVLEVRPTRINDQAHWIVRGLVGQKLEFDTLVTERVLNKIIAWKTVEGSLVGHAGIIRFEPIGDEATRVHVRMSYNPPGGALGHRLTRVLGADLKSMLDEDLARIKTTLETGRAPHDAAHSSGFERPNIE